MIGHRIIMSRQTKYDLIFPKAGAIKCLISLGKSFEPVTPFCQGIEGRPVRTVKVLAVDDTKPLSIEDIERVVPWSDVESYYNYRDESGEYKMLPIDKTVIKSLFKNSSTMKVEATIDSSAISPHMYDGSHYYVNVQVESKTKAVHAPSQKLYTVIYQYLFTSHKMLLVKFISNNREKHAVIYSDPSSNGLRMSILIHSTYQRPRTSAMMVAIPDAAKYGEKLLGGSLEVRELTSEMISDEYEERLKSYIEECKIADPSKRRAITVTIKPKTTEIDILEQIMDL